MIIKKFQGNTETEAIMKARDELGKDAIVTNVKQIKPGGLMRLFKKPTYEITAALDETPPKTELSRRESIKAMFKDNPDIILDDDKKDAKEDEKFTSSLSDPAKLEQKISNIAMLLEKQMGAAAKADSEKKDEEKKDTAEEKNNACLQLIYKQLLENEVDEKYINQLITEIEPALKKDGSVENILSGIYQKIVLKLGKTEVMGVTQGKARFVFFIGPTGVGKTTTIAKLASKLKLDRKLNVALLTADTYRIAAVDQLKTYAEILNVPLKVVYSDTELKDAYEEMKNYDIVLIDTAGRSHRDKQQREDIEKLISAVPAEERDIFLVLSITTKYSDLIRITQSYSEIAEYRLIFTKLDETDTLGNIFNVKLLTGAPLSYATFGQKVPNDISRLDAQMIAKQLLGGSD
ncbi:MAG: flagellar biosynthesis protein FlhF [Lachnospiraceae bacterium]|nr:flagellar biosynthesis protein FlhF [Lachnospiraceae bacterium]MBQ6026333.1 flagellar biosynthesis protein FlhF [Lachnospiraceae bacterium]MBR3484427.1 flagellar biosynthesis protein FlhF [Lachnospiraceae bacterium]MBR3580268.1 flagellar biosynthesis protein FlhF [Lachnospiraceae bacterium]